MVLYAAKHGSRGPDADHPCRAAIAVDGDERQETCPTNRRRIFPAKQMSGRGGGDQGLFSLRNAPEITSLSGLPDCPSSALQQQLHSPAMRLLLRLEYEQSFGAS